jgi:metallophosphoesterase superfamily enzyme
MKNNKDWVNKKFVLLPAFNRPFENVATGNIFLVILATSFFCILVTGNHDRKFPILFQNLHFELVTVLYDQNLLLELAKNQICVK